MTPRVRMTTVRAEDTAADVVSVSAATGFSRMPVIDEGPDDILGLVHVKRAFAVPPDRREITLARDLMFEPTRVPDTLGADALLSLLRAEALQMAVVTDEHGGTAGIVTLEDLVEEIVGELQDEHDRAHSGITRRGRSISFDASWRPDELLDRTGIEVPRDEDYETIAGYVLSRLEHMPELGDEVAAPAGTLRVERMDGPRIARIRFVPHSAATATTRDASGVEEAPHD
jgi:CBS domain containing-hemolysin-like protein